MSERNRMGEYAIKKLGAGAETDVYKPKKQAATARDKGVVIKDFARLSGDVRSEDARWVRGENGFDDADKLRLQDNYTRLRAAYGKVIAQARFIKNPDNPDLNLLVQEYVELADPARVGAYYPVDIEDDDALKLTLTHFVEAVKQNIRLARQHQPCTLPDLDGTNLVFNAQLNRIVYLDLGLYTLPEVHINMILQVARLALLGGVTASGLKADNFFKILYSDFPQLNDVDDVSDLYQMLLDVEDGDDLPILE